jgi:hypothetical protein
MLAVLDLAGRRAERVPDRRRLAVARRVAFDLRGAGGGAEHEVARQRREWKL